MLPFESMQKEANGVALAKCKALAKSTPSTQIDTDCVVCLEDRRVHIGRLNI